MVFSPSRKANDFHILTSSRLIRDAYVLIMIVVLLNHVLVSVPRSRTRTTVHAHIETAETARGGVLHIPEVGSRNGKPHRTDENTERREK